jgi:hypothetical protein
LAEPGGCHVVESHDQHIIKAVESYCAQYRQRAERHVVVGCNHSIEWDLVGKELLDGFRA